MNEFIPPFPKRHEKILGSLDTIKYGRHDLLSIWPEDAFSVQFTSVKILNRKIFIANCPKVVRHVFVTNNANYERKSPLMRKALEPLLGNGLFISDGAMWQKHRAIETPLFSTEQVAKYADVMIRATEECASRWAMLPSSSTLEVLPEMGKLTAEIICRSLFGNQLGVEQANTVVSSFAEYQATIIQQIDINTFFDLPGWVPSLTAFGLPRWVTGLKASKAEKAAKRIHEVVDKVIEKASKTSQQETLMDHFLKRLEAKNNSEAMTSEEIRNELIVLFMAGHETTANTLAWAWYLISQCPEVERRLHQELDEVLGNNPASFESFDKLVYTKAIIEETLRLYPPVPILTREAVGDDIIRKRHVPAGSIMVVAPWLLHRHKLYWDKPDHFIPDRFLPNAATKPDKYAYIPFSIGPRVCIAKFFGTVEATLCLAILAQRFRLTLPQGHSVTHECRLTLRPKDNLPMQIVRR